MIQAIYNKATRRITPAHGTVHIYPSSMGADEYEVILWQQADLQTARASYFIVTHSFENATRIYTEQVLPEIKRKERLYLARGIFDRQNT